VTESSFAVRGRLLFGTSLEPGTLVVSNGLIESVARGHTRNGNLPEKVIDASIVSPGMIDLQVNGADGVEADDNPRHIEQISVWTVKTGVTAWLPTVVTAPASLYPRVFNGWRSVDTSIGATPLGWHLEGPFLAPARKGAHQLQYIEDATEDIFDNWLLQDSIRLVTLAPERAGADDKIRKLVDRGVLVSLGHTDATFDEFRAGVDLGATKATHLFNAMSPMHHRNPGAMIATLTDDRITAGLIPDAIHSHPATVKLAIKSKGPDRIAVVSDMISSAGLGPGTYDLGGQPVFVDQTTAKLENGTLAGSVLTMDKAVRNLVDWGDASAAEALHMCTRVPARLLEDDSRGRLVAGCRADLTLWSSELVVERTIVSGQVRYDESA
jgi:N-acetylglucosamine-6-phosphate deacetylase